MCIWIRNIPSIWSELLLYDWSGWFVNHSKLLFQSRWSFLFFVCVSMRRWRWWWGYLFLSYRWFRFCSFFRFRVLLFGSWISYFPLLYTFLVDIQSSLVVLLASLCLLCTKLIHNLLYLFLRKVRMICRNLLPDVVSVFRVLRGGKSSLPLPSATSHFLAATWTSTSTKTDTATLLFVARFAYPCRLR